MIFLKNNQIEKILFDIQKGIIPPEIIQMVSKMVYVSPSTCVINDIVFDKKEYNKIIDYLKSLNVVIIEFVDVSSKVIRKLINE